VAQLLGAPQWVHNFEGLTDEDGNPIELWAPSEQGWVDEDGNEIQVGFDKNGRVLYKVYHFAPCLPFQERMKRKILKRIWP
jgi:hypothetical protein